MLRDELTTDPAGLGYVLADPAQIERVINAPTRSRMVPTEVGKGDAIDVLGLDTGNALCDLIDGAPQFRHVKHLLEAGRLRLDFAITQAALGALVGTALTAEQLQALNSLAIKPCSRAEELGLPRVTQLAILEALEGVNPPAWTAEVLGVAPQGVNVVATVRYSSTQRAEVIDEQVPGNDLTTEALAAWMRRKVHLLTLRDLSLATF